MSGRFRSTSSRVGAISKSSQRSCGNGYVRFRTVEVAETFSCKDVVFASRLYVFSTSCTNRSMPGAVEARGPATFNVRTWLVLRKSLIVDGQSLPGKTCSQGRAHH